MPLKSMVIKLLIKYLLMHTHMSLTLTGHSQYCSLGPERITHSQIPLTPFILQVMHICVAYFPLYAPGWAVGIQR